MDIMKEALAIEAQVIAWQEHFHVNAELSQKEEHTVEVIIRHLEKLGIEYVNVPDGGVLGFIRGGKPGKTVLLRGCHHAAAVVAPVHGGSQPDILEI